ncbi:AAA-like domain-containing protein [Roseburia hominis]
MENKTFNVTGVCIPDKHYMADVSGKLKKITETFIKPGKYFTINRARQYGKTTTLYLLERYLQKDYLVISLSFEAADDLFASRYSFAAGFIRRVGRKMRQLCWEDAVQEKWNVPISREFPMEDLSDRISELCLLCGKRIVLMVDEVDKSSDNQIFLSFLGMLRTKYLEQQQGTDRTFHSVILAGVYDVKNLKLKLNPGEESKYNSPWNVAADFDVNMNLSVCEIEGMLSEYEKDHMMGMDLHLMAQEIYDYTSGYPFLVSKICKRMVEDIEEKIRWTRYGVSETVKLILNESNTLFDDMRKKITDYPELREMLYAILFKGQSFAYNPDNFIMDVGCMFGFIKEEDGKAVIANRIFETRLYNLFLSEEMLNNQTYLAGARVKNQFVQDDGLNIEDKVLVEVVV